MVSSSHPGLTRLMPHVLWLLLQLNFIFIFHDWICVGYLGQATVSCATPSWQVSMDLSSSSKQITAAGPRPSAEEPFHADEPSFSEKNVRADRVYSM